MGNGFFMGNGQWAMGNGQWMGNGFFMVFRLKN
jgi:hypothetical protein